MHSLQHKFMNLWISSCLITHKLGGNLYKLFKTGKGTSPGLRISFPFHQTAVYDNFYSFSTIIHGNWKYSSVI